MLSKAGKNVLKSPLKKPGQTTDKNIELTSVTTNKDVKDTAGLKNMYNTYKDAAENFTAQGQEHFQRGQYDEALKMFSAAMDSYKTVHSERHPNVAQCYNNIGNVYKAMGRFEVALVKYEEALRIMKIAFGDENSNLAVSLTNIGNVHYGMGRFEEALVMYEEAYRLKKDPKILNAINDSRRQVGSGCCGCVLS